MIWGPHPPAVKLQPRSMTAPASRATAARPYRRWYVAPRKRLSCDESPTARSDFLRGYVELAPQGRKKTPDPGRHGTYRPLRLTEEALLADDRAMLLTAMAHGVHYSGVPQIPGTRDTPIQEQKPTVLVTSAPLEPETPLKSSCSGSARYFTLSRHEGIAMHSGHHTCRPLLPTRL